MLVQAQVVPWWGTGRPAECSLSGSHPVAGIANGRRIGGYDYKTESFQRPRAEHYTRFREIRNSNFFGAPSPGGQSVREITSREETERPPENRLGRSQPAPACPTNRSPLQIWLCRSNRSPTDLTGAWTTRAQARRVRADPSDGRKPKAYP